MSSGSFWLFAAAIGIVTCFFVYFMATETKSHSLEEIEQKSNRLAHQV